MKRSIFFLSLFAFACSNSEKESTLSKEKLAMILVDIHLAEAKINEKHIGSSDSALVLFQELQRRIFKKHGVDSALVNKSYDVYVKEPEEFVEMYKLVSEELSKTPNISTGSKAIQKNLSTQ